MARIATRIVFEIESGRVLEFEGYEYDGPVELCGGGPSSEQKDAAASQRTLTDQEAQNAATDEARQTTAYNQIQPYATGMMKNGLSYYGSMADWAGGNAAKAYAPARAALNRQLSSIGSLPSGFKTAQNADLNESEAQNYDQGLQSAQQQQQAAKQAGAQMILGQQSTYNPNQAYSTAMSGNTSIMNAPLTSPGWQGVVGGLIGGASQVGSAAITKGSF